MMYEVTQEQYDNLIRARDNWPERFSFGWTGFNEDKRCIIAHLTREAGLEDEEMCTKYFFGVLDFKYENLPKLSKIYGIPDGELRSLYKLNISTLGSKIRSKKAFRAFQKFLDDVVVYGNKKESISIEEKTEGNKRIEDYLSEKEEELSFEIFFST